MLAEGNPREGEDFDQEQLSAADEDLDLFTSELYHVHLPKLEERGYITWDRDADEISHGPNYEEIEPLVTLMGDHEDELPADWP